MENHQPTRRRRYSASQRREFVELFERSDLTQSAFARKHGLKLCTLHQWLHRSNTTSSRGAVFKEVRLPAQLLVAAPGVEIAVGGDITLRLGSHSSPEFIAQVIEHLRRPC